MNFTSEINITCQEGFDMTIDCPSSGIPSLKKHLLTEGFTISDERIFIPGTKNISDLIKMEVRGNEFTSLRETIIRFLESKNTKYTEDQFNSPSDLHCRFNLEDKSIFDKVN